MNIIQDIQTKCTARKEKQKQYISTVDSSKMLVLKAPKLRYAYVAGINDFSDAPVSTAQNSKFKAFQLYYE